MNTQDLLQIYNQCSWALSADVGLSLLSSVALFFGLVSE
jgi:hypothetical protein